MSEITQEEDWNKHPQYLADAGALFGAPPNLVCQNCHEKSHELFFGHCRECAGKKNIPQNVAEPEKFHETLDSGRSVLIEGVPAKWYPWWHYKRWF